MGWSGIPKYELSRTDTKGRQEYFDHWVNTGWPMDGGGYRMELLRSAMRGTTYYAAIKDKVKNNVWAIVILTNIEDGFFYYKEISEDMGPCESDCPKAIIDLLSPTDCEYALEWRKRCLDNLAKKAAQSKAQRSDGGYVIDSSYGKLAKKTSAHIFFVSWKHPKPLKFATREEAQAFLDTNINPENVKKYYMKVLSLQPEPKAEPTEEEQLAIIEQMFKTA